MGSSDGVPQCSHKWRRVICRTHLAPTLFPSPGRQGSGVVRISDSHSPPLTHCAATGGVVDIPPALQDMLVHDGLAQNFHSCERLGQTPAHL